MPHELFGDVTSRRAARTRFRRTLTIGSVALHAVVIGAVLVAQLLAVGPLPVPRRPLIFETISLVKMIDIPLPAPARRSSTDAGPTVSPDAAPLTPPSGITRETGLEQVHSTVVRSDAVDGVERGAGATFGPIGTVVGPPAPPTPHTPIRLHSGMQTPVKTVHVAPVYPSIAQSAHVQGVVILEAVIDARGHVTSVSVLRSIPLLDQAAVDAVRQWRFSPALLNGQTVPVVMTVTVNFTLDR